MRSHVRHAREPPWSDADIVFDDISGNPVVHVDPLGDATVSLMAASGDQVVRRARRGSVQRAESS